MNGNLVKAYATGAVYATSYDVPCDLTNDDNRPHLYFGEEYATAVGFDGRNVLGNFAVRVATNDDKPEGC
jgi:hypothetical protein